jgi:hypothetical protein
MQSWKAFVIYSAKLSQLKRMFLKLLKKYIVDCFSDDPVFCGKKNFIAEGVLPMGRYGQL